MWTNVNALPCTSAEDATAQYLFNPSRFYARVFKDEVLSKFLFESDGAAAHGTRFANWLAEKMGGEGRPWTASGRDGMRQVSHSRAWHSERRPTHERGRRFKLPDCRVWMRLHFWAARECGLSEHPQFWAFYVDFIRHFVGIYESTAPPYAKESADWSANRANIDKYLADGCKMVEVLRQEG